MKFCLRCKAKINLKTRFNLNEYYCNICNTKYKKQTKLYNAIATVISTIFTIYSLEMSVSFVSKLILFKYIFTLKFIIGCIIWITIYKLMIVILDIFLKYEDIK